VRLDDGPELLPVDMPVDGCPNQFLLAKEPGALANYMRKLKNALVVEYLGTCVTKEDKLGQKNLLRNLLPGLSQLGQLSTGPTDILRFEFLSDFTDCKANRGNLVKAFNYTDTPFLRVSPR
jgi:hypothetical protein